MKIMKPQLPIDLFEQRRHKLLNMIHTWLLAGGSLVLLGVTAWAFGGVTAIIWAILFGAVSLFIAGRVSPQMVLRMYKAEQIDQRRFPDGYRILGELSRRAGLLEMPKLYVIPSRMMNAFAVGRRDNSAIAVSDALVRGLTLREFAGVLAHEVSHIAHEDVRVMAFADMVSRYTSFMSTMGMLSLFFNIGGFAVGYGTQVPWFAVLILIASPTIGSLLQLALSRTREFDADLGAAMLTGDPMGLASALQKLERVQGRRWENMMLPSGRIPDPSMLRTHPKTEDRVARLRALQNSIEGGSATAGQQQGRETVKRRASPIPKIRLSEAERLGPWVRFAARHAAEPPVHEGDPDGHPSNESLVKPDGPPRIRIRRGGVWW